MRPLADEIRPQTLDEVAGQKHLLGEGALLRRLIESGAEANLIFYGPIRHGEDHHCQHHRPPDEKDPVPPQCHHGVPAGRKGGHQRRGHHAGS